MKIYTILNITNDLILERFITLIIIMIYFTGAVGFLAANVLDSELPIPTWGSGGHSEGKSLMHSSSVIQYK